MNTDPTILTQPNIPKPLHGLSPRTIFGTQWWNKARFEAYKENDYRCKACGVHKKDALFHSWLEGHEIYDIDYNKGIATFIEVVSLCHACHNFIHSGRLGILLKRRIISKLYVDQILRHGLKILYENNQPAFFGTVELALSMDIELANKVSMWKPDNTVEWSKWKMSIYGDEYYSKFKDINDWETYYKKYDTGKH